MKKSQLIALTTLTTLTTLVAGATICLIRKSKQKKRLVAISDAGYETAYDIHYPIKYRG